MSTMFFKKRKKDQESENMKKCESPGCPTPESLYPVENLNNLDGLNLCQFCYARHLSEKTVETVFEESGF